LPDFAPEQAIPADKLVVGVLCIREYEKKWTHDDEGVSDVGRAYDGMRDAGFGMRDEFAMQPDGTQQERPDDVIPSRIAYHASRIPYRFLRGE
jgi:hypothetical protein